MYATSPAVAQAEALFWASRAHRPHTVPGWRQACAAGAAGATPENGPRTRPKDKRQKQGHLVLRLGLDMLYYEKVNYYYRRFVAFR